MPTPPAPVLADRYELGAVLGRGGMADVHRARDRVLGREVAVKVLRDAAQDDADRARFTAEARTLAGLSHSGLVMVLDAGTTAEQPFLVMELVEGLTLAELLARGPLSAQAAAEVGVRVADALAYAHAQGVVHRDVKPGNVLMGSEGRVKLADFGIARLIGDTVRHTRTGTAVGTAAYLAPEQVTGDDATGAADVYSLGLVLLEALTGQRAYSGSPTEAALARLSRQPEMPPSLPGWWRSLLTAMTAREPAERPAAAEVVATLRAQPTAPVPDTATRTAVLTDTGPTVARQPAARARTAPIDRAGDRITHGAADGWRRVRDLPPHVRGVVAVVVALLLLIVVVGLAAGGGDGSGGSTPVPEDTPTDLQQPLQDLHDAVEGQ